MKIFIVTSGEYSDYGINRVFLNQENADRYVEVYNRGQTPYNHARIEEYDVTDGDDGEFDVREIRYVEVSYDFYNQQAHSYCEFSSVTSVDNPNIKSGINYHEHSDGWYGFDFKRVINNNHDDVYWRNKYEKVCFDLAAQIQYWRTVDRMSVDEINAALGKWDGDNR